MNLAFGITKLIDVALEIATEAHKGQTRWDKSPYINHPVRVAELASYIYQKDLSITLDQYNENFYNTLIISSLDHDIPEDVEKWVNKEFELIEYLEGRYGEKISYKNEIIMALVCLNKHRYSNYLNFVLASKNNRAARYVKIADLTHNLSDLTKGSMKEKYQLALYILEN